MTRKKLISEDADAWNKKGGSLRIQGKYEEALRLDPEYALYELGKAY
jgi:hypothetical protein